MPNIHTLTLTLALHIYYFPSQGIGQLVSIVEDIFPTVLQLVVFYACTRSEIFFEGGGGRVPVD